MKFRDHGYEARSQRNHLVDVVNMESRLEVRKTVVHLNCSLRITKVEYFIDSSSFFYSCNIGGVVVETHLSPGPDPVCWVFCRV